MKKNLKKMIILIVIAIVLVASGFIYLGINLNKKATSSVIVTTVLDDILAKVNSFFYNDKQDYKKDFDFSSNIMIDNKVSGKDNLNANYKLLKSIVKDIKPYEANIKYQQNTKEKKLFLQIDELLEKTRLNAKLLVENATEYYFIDNYTKTYVNNGTNNYFENLVNNSNEDNFKYLKDFIYQSFKDNLKEDYFTKYSTEVSINGKVEKVNRISIKFTNERLQKIFDNILNDLKNDERACLILSNYDKDFKKKKYLGTFLNDDTSITLNIYVDRWFSKFRKLEIVNLVGNDEGKITYEEDDDNERKVIYIISNNKVDEYIEIKNKKITIYNATNKNIGSVDIEKDKKKKLISFYLNDDNNHLEFSFKDQNEKKDNQLNNEKELILKLRVNKEDIIDLALKSEESYLEGTAIEEKVDEVVLESSMNADDKKEIEKIEGSKFLQLIK